jgi:hypothetical protein
VAWKWRRCHRARTSGDIDYRAAVLTESLVARGIVTALAWLGVPQRAFAVSDHVHAANYLGLTSSELDLILQELPRIRNSAPPYAIAG